MHENRPSVTAHRVAMRRAAHQILDRPKVLDDPIALRILGPGTEAEILANSAENESPPSRYLRAFVVARSRLAEDELSEAVARGVRQYAILGAGLDTFAYRNPHAAHGLKVFEVDYPATQSRKRQLLADAGIPIPEGLTFVPIDFATQTLSDQLLQSGFRPEHPAFFSWLGVTMYLAHETVMATLQRFVESTTKSSEIVFDYAMDPSLIAETQRIYFEAMARRVALAGEPFQSWFDPASLPAQLRALGFTEAEDIDGDAINRRYFADRSDRLCVANLSHMIKARN